jgi:hypothetical protein
MTIDARKIAIDSAKEFLSRVNTPDLKEVVELIVENRWVSFWENWVDMDVNKNLKPWLRIQTSTPQ